MRNKVTLTNKKRLIIAFAFFLTALILLCIRVGFIQIVHGTDYTEKAIQQQTKDEIVEAKRGEILDRNGNIMATSTIKYSVWVRPSAFMNSNDKDKNTKKLKKVSKELGEILGIDAKDLKKQLSGDTALVKVAKYQEKDVADKVREWAVEEDIDGVSITEETKRYYPLDNMAAQVLGSVTDDNNGLSGLELYYNNYLKGIPGRWIQNKDASGRSLSYGNEAYYEAEDGCTLTLTLDSVIQNYAENACSKVYQEQEADNVSCIVMESTTGEILAMASCPSFNPNNSRQPTDSKELATFKGLSASEQMAYLNNMWRNPLVNDTYIPGSTMKLVTTSMALEEDLTNVEENFYDSGSIDVNGIALKCWSYTEPHGAETLKKSVRNSCNPVFVQLAQRIGTANFYDYLALFGLTEKTGIDYPGEASSQLQNESTLDLVGLSTMGYGQGMAVTPIQQISAVNVIANDGKLVKPHLVKSIEDKDGKTVKSFKTKITRKVISSETASVMRDVMKFVYEDGGVGDAKVEGYTIGCKTGTANVEAENNKIIASFVGVAPIDDPKITVMFIVNNPKNGTYGSTVAAPGGIEIINNTLRYMDTKGMAD